MGKEPLTVALIPAYDEEATISEVIQQTLEYVSKVIVCDDGSKDLTGKNAAAAGAIVATHKTNLGKGAALRTLFAEAMKTNADYVITLDADGQHEPSDIPRLIKAIRESGADIVVGSRFTKNGMSNNVVPRRRAIGNRMLSILTDLRVSDTQSGFRAYRKAVLGLIVPRTKKMGVDSEILMRAREEGLRMLEVPIKVKYDVPNPSKQNQFSTTFQVAFGVLQYLSVRRPRLFYGVPAVAALTIALGFWIRSATLLSIRGQIVGNNAIIAIGATIIGLTLSTIAIILWRFIIAVRRSSVRKT